MVLAGCNNTISSVMIILFPVQVGMVWAKKDEEPGPVAASRSDTELVEAGSRQSRR